MLYDVRVMMVSYRGYGLSTGVASEKGMKIDAQTALEHVLKTYPDSKIVVYGMIVR